MPSVSEYVDNEFVRLNDKRKTMDDAISAQKRVIMLNESYRKRFSRYTQMVMIISIVFIIYLGVFALRKSFPMIPEVATDVLLAVVFFIGVVYCINIIMELMSRNIVNYDELEIPPFTEIETKTEIDPNAPSTK